MSLPSDATALVDLVVVGFGGAGAAAALRAVELGASVAVLEKQPEALHTPSTKMSGGLVMAVDDVDAATRYLSRCSAGLIPDAVSRAWAEKAAGLVSWLEVQLADLALVRTGGPEHPSFAGSSAIHVYCQSQLRDGSRVGNLNDNRAGTGGAGHGDGRFQTGRELFGALQRAVSGRGAVQVTWGARAQRLLSDDARVVGVEWTDGQDVRTIGARHGVVLASGGFEFNDDMKANFLRTADIHFYGNTANTGDGLRMAIDVGADLWHMPEMAGRAIGHFETHDGEWHNFVIYLEPGGYVLTDKYGRRFANEYWQAKLRHDFYLELLAYDSENEDYPRIPCYWFFDQTRMRARPLTSLVSGLVAVGAYDWSGDNRKEVKQGWIAEGATIAQAASQAGVLDPDQAELTVAEYNRVCEDANTADRFGRPRESLKPLIGPPYYCVALYPGGSNTCGGPRRNEHGQILDTRGNPIPALYGAGELGQATGLLYPADGSNLSEAFCFGQIAAEHALRGG